LKRGNGRAVLEALAPHSEALVGVVVESTFNWYWLVDAMMEAGYRVHLANTAALVQYTGLNYSDDDSRHRPGVRGDHDTGDRRDRPLRPALPLRLLLPLCAQRGQAKRRPP